MAKKSNKPRKVTPEVASLLRRIRTRNADTSPLAAMSLADHLELNDLPLAKSVRNAVNTYLRDINYWSTADFWRMRLGRDEVLERVRTTLYSGILDLFGRVTTSDGPRAEKVIADKLAELRHLRARIKRLETSAGKRGKQLIRLAKKYAQDRLKIAEWKLPPGEVTAPGGAIVVLDYRTVILPSKNNNQHETPSEDGEGRDSTNGDETS